MDTKISIASVAQILGISIAKAHDKFKAGDIELEDLIAYVEEHSGHPSYSYRIAMIERIEQKLIKEMKHEAD